MADLVMNEFEGLSKDLLRQALQREARMLLDRDSKKSAIRNTGKLLSLQRTKGDIVAFFHPEIPSSRLRGMNKFKRLLKKM